MAKWLDLTLSMAQSYLIVKILDCCVPQFANLNQTCVFCGHILEQPVIYFYD